MLALLSLLPESATIRYLIFCLKPEFSGLTNLERSSKEVFFKSNFFIGMDQHGADSSQPDPGSARPNFHSPAASSVSLYQPADLPCDRYPCPPGSAGMAGKSGPSLRHHHLNQLCSVAKGRRHSRYTAKKYLGFINCLFVGDKLRNNKLVNLCCLSTWDCVCPSLTLAKEVKHGCV